MTTTVARTDHRLGSSGELATLEQRFLFRGPATARDAGELLMSAPLTGSGSIFGDRPGEEVPSSEGTRALRGFSPAPGFTFDVELSRRDATTFVVGFSQPERPSPYLAGRFLWRFEDTPEGVELHEQINTPEALSVVTQPLGGDGPSLRRWVFFRVGHAQVMAGATRNLAALLP